MRSPACKDYAVQEKQCGPLFVQSGIESGPSLQIGKRAFNCIGSADNFSARRDVEGVQALEIESPEVVRVVEVLQSLLPLLAAFFPFFHS
jgi:hypothetical protein